MWTKPYGMKEGFLIGGGLIIIGLILEMMTGPIDWDVFRWPVNGIVLIGFLTIIAVAFLLRKKVYAFRFISTYQAAIPALVYVIVLTVIMGLTRQEPRVGEFGSGTEANGTWLNNMLTFWSFPFPAESFGFIPRHDYRHIRQCRHAAVEDDCGKGRA